MRTKGAAIAIRGHYIRIVLVEAVLGHGLEKVVPRVGTLYISLISIRVNLLGQFMLYLRLSMEASLVILIILARFMVSL